MFTTFISFTLGVLAIQTAQAFPFNKRASAYFPPSENGGSQLDFVSPGLGEPLNIIISGLSSPAVLTDDGFTNFAQALGFSSQCLSIGVGGNPQSANLGDGNGAIGQVMELRQDYGHSLVGLCEEVLIGGNHMRMFRQNGPTANTGALFLAVSREENLLEDHTIVPNGYNIGRDQLVANATNGHPSSNGVTYSVAVEQLTGLLAPGSTGVNHGISQDGVVKLLTVTIV